MDNAAATATSTPTVSLTKNATPSHCLGDGSPARPWVLHRTDSWWRDQR